MAVSNSIVKDYTRVCKQNERLVAKVDKLTDKIDGIKNEHKSALRNLKLRHKDEISELKARHRAEKREYEARIRELEKALAAKDKEMERLEERNSLLEARAEGKKGRVSTPTGRDVDTPGNEKRPKRKKGDNHSNNTRADGDGEKRKRGGQEGHDGATLLYNALLAALEGKANVLFDVRDIGDPNLPYRVQHEVDLVLGVRLTEIRIHEDAYEPNRKGGVTVYGSAVKALAIMLRTLHSVPYKRTVDIIEAVTGSAIRPSTGSVSNWEKDFQKRTNGDRAHLEEEIRAAKAVNTDGTTMATPEARRCVRVFCAGEKRLYFALETKKLDDMAENTMAPSLNSVLIHDHESAAYHFGSGHEECATHTLRYMRECEGNTGHQWVIDIKKLLKDILAARKLLISEGWASFPQADADYAWAEWDRLIEEGWRQNGESGGKVPKWALDDERKLLRRLGKYKANHLLFMGDFDIEPDNNRAERALRPCKVTQKVSGGFRSFQGLSVYADNLGPVKTAEQEGYPILESLMGVFEGRPIFGDCPAPDDGGSPESNADIPKPDAD